MHVFTMNYDVFQAGIRGFLADPYSPLEWIDPEARGPDPCPPRETGRCILHYIVTVKVFQSNETFHALPFWLAPID